MKHDPFPLSRPRPISLRGVHRLRSLSILELGLITVILAIALAVVIPGYLHLQQESRDGDARARLVDATRVLERHRSVAGTYRGAILPAGVDIGSIAPTSYCVETSAGDRSWHASGPYGAKPEQGGCPAP